MEPQAKAVAIYRLPSRRLDDQIRELCSKVIATTDSTEFALASKELNRALKAQTQRIRNMIAAYPAGPEQLRSGKPETLQLLAPSSFCARPVTLERDKVDENGKPVHEECNVAKITQNPSTQ
jgi:hypothetical protein